MAWAVVALSCLTTPVAISAQAQGQVQPGSIVIDSLAVEGNVRLEREEVLDLTGLVVGQPATVIDVRDAQKRLMASGHFADVEVHAYDAEGGSALLLFRVEERALVRAVRILGLENVDPGMVRDSIGLAPGLPYSPVKTVRARDLIRAELADRGIPFASVQERLVPVPERLNVVDLVIDVEEGQRVTIAELEISGNDAVSKSTIVGAMRSRSEGFFWFRTGSFDEEAYQEDLRRNIPRIYYQRGYLDFEILSDTLVIDPETGKALVRLEVEEGEQYRIARFSIDGNSEFTDRELEQYFREETGGLLQTLGIAGANLDEVAARGEVFDQVRFETALQRVKDAYNNRGYVWADVVPGVEKVETADGEPAVALTVNVVEGNPAYVNRVDIVGNDYTHEWVIRDRIFILPGDVFNLQRVIQSYQNVQALGFFETPMPFPNIEQNEQAGTVDITFRVVEARTGTLNFGTSVGGGVGLTGFVGYDQPNLFGQAKEGHLRWDFGRFLNNLRLSFSDPALFQSRVSGSISVFNARDRFSPFDDGQRRRIGGGVRFGFPIPNAPRTRFFVGYSLSRTDYEIRSSGVTDTSLFDRNSGTQSQMSLGLVRNTLNHPIFPTEGSQQSLNTELNGGLLGGNGDFQKVTVEGQWWVPVGQLGDGQSGPPAILATGVQLRGGAVLGDAGNFPFERFFLGGVQFGEQLRGYDETTITPLGFVPDGARDFLDINRLGNAFLSVTAETALRFSDRMSLSTFFDAGNVWREPGDVDPTSLFKGAGFGLTLVTPFGPVGLDYAYGFDKTEPGWQLHFQFGQAF